MRVDLPAGVPMLNAPLPSVLTMFDDPLRATLTPGRGWLSFADTMRPLTRCSCEKPAVCIASKQQQRSKSFLIMMRDLNGGS